MDTSFQSKLLAELKDPQFVEQLKGLLDQRKNVDDEPTTYAPFYRNKVGKVTKGHLNLERYKRDLELTPIHEDEAVALGLMTKAEAEALKSDAPVVEEEVVDLNSVSDEELADLRERARALNIPSWQVKGVARLRGDIKKAELKAKNESSNE